MYSKSKEYSCFYNRENYLIKEKRTLILSLSGHIRESFKDNRLYNFIYMLNSNYNLHIYLHTWNIVQNNLSWRIIDEDNTNVSEEKIKSYFNDLAYLIKYIKIDDDKKISLFGNIEGTIGNGTCPIKGWKNMWYGKYQLANNFINDNTNLHIPILNTRYDIFNLAKGNDNELFNYVFNEDNILLFINNNYKSNYTKNIFIFDKETYGIDNVYIGDSKTVYNLCNHFNFNLDNILSKYPTVYNQEFLVYKENEILF